LWEGMSVAGTWAVIVVRERRRVKQADRCVTHLAGACERTFHSPSDLFKKAEGKEKVGR
jgi:hypothetical protein